MEFFDDVSKTSRLQRRAADQRAVHIRLAHQLLGVVRLHAAAVLNAHLFGRGFVEQLHQHGANERVRVLRLLRRGGLARANRPDRFVGDDGFNHLFPGQSGEAAAHLRFENFFHLAAFAFRQRFADADNRLERRAVGGLRLFGDERVRLLLILPPLAVAEDDVTHGKFLEHAGADFAGERAEIILAHVLRAEAQVGIENGLGHLAQRGEGRSNDNVNLLHAREFALEVAYQRKRLGDGFVHFPVACNDEFSFFVHIFVN
jgi:hypothetical protein